jgi:hypothetical protein
MDAKRAPRRVLVFALAVLAWQIILPLTYYVRDDPYDERFAWRMFSAERMHVCSTRAIEIVADGGSKGVRRIPLENTLHQAWLTHIKRNRRPVVHRFLEWRCESPGVSGVRLVNRCAAADRRPLAPRHYAIDCASGAISERTSFIAVDTPDADTSGVDSTKTHADDAGETTRETE